MKIYADEKFVFEFRKIIMFMIIVCKVLEMESQQTNFECAKYYY
jgi:hypothetical protein